MSKREKDGNGAKIADRGSRQELSRRQDEGALTPSSRGEHPLRWLSDEMHALFDHFFGHRSSGAERAWDMDRFWDVGVEETDNEIVVRADAPGFEPKDFDIHVSGNTLTIQADHKEETEEKDQGYRRWERRYGRLRREVGLSSAVHADRVEARYRNGVLEVHLPRTEPRSTRRIEVKT